MKSRQLVALIVSFILLFAFGTVAQAQTVPQATPTPEAEAETEAEADVEAELPHVQVSEQGVVDGRVNIVRAVVPGPAWVVIHADADGRPGPVIGHAALETGENLDVVVEIDVDAVTLLLHAMLHVDEGEVGIYEFPGADGPLTIEDDIVMAIFSAAPPAAPEDEEEEAEVEAATSTEAPGAEATPEAEEEDEAEAAAAEPTPEAEEEEEAEAETMAAEPTPEAEEEADEEAEMAAPDADAKGAAPTEMPSTGAGAPLSMILAAITAVVSALGGSVVFARRHRA